MRLSIKNPYPTSYPQTYDVIVQSIRTKADNGKIPKNRPTPPKKVLMFILKLNFQYGCGSYINHSCHAISTKIKKNIIAKMNMTANPLLPSLSFGERCFINFNHNNLPLIIFNLFSFITSLSTIAS